MSQERMDAVLLIRIDDTLKRRVKRAARADGRSISGYVRRVLEKELEKQTKS